MNEINLNFEKELQENINKIKDIIKIKGEEYEKIKTGIIYIIKNFEKMEKKCSKKNIIEKFLEEKFKSLESEKESEILVEKINGVIDRMCEKENILIKMEDPEQIENEIYQINVNYDVPLFE